MKTLTKRMKSVLATILFVGLSANFLHAQWTKQTTGLPSYFDGIAAMDACDPSTAVIISGRDIYRTITGGDIWQKLKTPVEVIYALVDVAITDSLHIWVCNSEGKIFNTADGGANWTLQFYDTSQTNFMDYIEMFDLQNGIAMGDDIKLAAGPAPILRTKDGGANWISINDSAFGGYSGDTWRRIDFIDTSTGFFFESGVNPGKLYRTTNGCSSWWQTPYPDYVQVLKFYDARLGMAIPGTYIFYRTIDGGESWESFTAPHQGWGNDIEFAPDNPAKVWLTDAQVIYFSSDTGRTWKAQLTARGRDIIFVDDQIGWVVGEDGVYHTKSGGELTAVEGDGIQKPGRFELLQNYPNPFNSTTTICFSLDKPARVSLKIYNILGQEILELLDKELSPGIHSIQWDGKNSAGQQVGSGLYFARLETKSQTKFIKMLLIR